MEAAIWLVMLADLEKDPRKARRMRLQAILPIWCVNAVGICLVAADLAGYLPK